MLNSLAAVDILCLMFPARVSGVTVGDNDDDNKVPNNCNVTFAVISTSLVQGNLSIWSLRVVHIAHKRSPPERLF